MVNLTEQQLNRAEYLLNKIANRSHIGLSDKQKEDSALRYHKRLTHIARFVLMARKGDVDTALHNLEDILAPECSFYCDDYTLSLIIDVMREELDMRHKILLELARCYLSTENKAALYKEVIDAIGKRNAGELLYTSNVNWRSKRGLFELPSFDEALNAVESGWDGIKVNPLLTEDDYIEYLKILKELILRDLCADHTAEIAYSSHAAFTRTGLVLTIQLCV